MPQCSARPACFGPGDAAGIEFIDEIGGGPSVRLKKNRRRTDERSGIVQNSLRVLRRRRETRVIMGVSFRPNF